MRLSKGNQIQPGAVFGREGKCEPVGSCLQIGLSFLGDVGRVVVGNHHDTGLLRIGLIDAFEQADELHAAVAFVDLCKDLTRHQVQSGQQAQRAQAFVFIVAPACFVLAGLGGQLWPNALDGLYARLLINR